MGVVTPSWIGAARDLEGALTSGRGGGLPRPERFVSEARSVRRDVRWRWTLKVFWTAA